jgi:hypothetical protein
MNWICYLIRNICSKKSFSDSLYMYSNYVSVSVFHFWSEGSNRCTFCEIRRKYLRVMLFLSHNLSFFVLIVFLHYFCVTTLCKAFISFKFGDPFLYYVHRICKHLVGTVWWYFYGWKGGSIVEGSIFPCFKIERVQDFLLLVWTCIIGTKSVGVLFSAVVDFNLCIVMFN